MICIGRIVLFCSWVVACFVYLSECKITTCLFERPLFVTVLNLFFGSLFSLLILIELSL